MTATAIFPETDPVSFTITAHRQPCWTPGWITTNRIVFPRVGSPAVTPEKPETFLPEGDAVWADLDSTSVPSCPICGRHHRPKSSLAESLENVRARARQVQEQLEAATRECAARHFQPVNSSQPNPVGTGPSIPVPPQASCGAGECPAPLPLT